MCSVNYLLPEKKKSLNSIGAPGICPELNYISKIRLIFFFLTLMLSIILSAGRLHAETVVSGNIFENTTWSLTGSPYVVSGSVIVNNGFTLTIEPGVVVKFDAGTSLRVDGMLVSRGTEGNMIVFTSTQPSPAPGDWGNILFTDSSTDATYDTDGNYAGGSILEYLIVEYAGSNDTTEFGRGSLHLHMAHPYINKNIIRNNQTSGIGAINLSGILKITDNAIYGNTSTSAGGGVFTENGTVSIVNNSIDNNTAQNGGGIYINGGTVTVSGNLINHNKTSDSYYTLNGGGGIAVNSGDNLPATVTISNNIITGNEAAIAGGGINVAYWRSQVTISNNIISNNKAMWAGGGIFRYYSIVDILSNTISGNSSDYGSAIYDWTPFAAEVSNNTITRNRIAEYQAWDTDPGSTVHITLQPNFNYNNIFGNSSDKLPFYELSNHNSQGSEDVNAKNNWWGTAVQAEIEDKIFDMVDDSTRGRVDFAPWQTAIITGNPVSPPSGLMVSPGVAPGEIVISWNANPEEDVAGYRVYWGADAASPYSQMADAGNVTSHTITNLTPGVYQIGVTAYDADDASVANNPNTPVNEKQTAGHESWYGTLSGVNVPLFDSGGIQQPVFSSATYIGGSGNESGTGIALADEGLYISGNSIVAHGSNAGAIIARMDLPPASAPDWLKDFGFGTNFFGLAAAGDGVYAAGYSYSLTTDSAGGKEVKSILVKFLPDGSPGGGTGDASWIATPNFFSYGGVEGFRGVMIAEEAGTPYLYVAGGGQPCSYGAYTISKYDLSGNLTASATDSTAGIQFNQCYVPAGGGGSDAFSVATINGKIYLAGHTGWAFEGDGSGAKAALWKYDPDLNLVWRKKDILVGGYRKVVADGNAIYAVGYRTNGSNGGYDVLIAKYDENGGLLWNKEWGGSSDDLAYALAIRGNRVYVTGETKSFGYGGKDIFLLNVDATNGTVISTNFWGGGSDDVANDMALYGSDIYMVGETSSFGSGGKDMALLKYTLNSARVSGRLVTSVTGEVTGISGATITLNETGQSTVSDSNGYFTLDNIFFFGTGSLEIGKQSFGTIILDNIQITEGQITEVPTTDMIVNSGEGMYTQEELDQAVADAVGVKDAIIAQKDTEIGDLNASVAAKEQTINDLNAAISSMYTQEQLDQAVYDAVSKFDINRDGKIGLEEAIHALQVISGMRNPTY